MTDTLRSIHERIRDRWTPTDRADIRVIRGVQGEFYPCKPDIFAATYEAVDAEAGRS